MPISQFGTIQLTNMTGTHAQNWIAGYARALEEGTSFNSASKRMNDGFAETLKRDGIDPDSLNSFEESARQLAFAKEELANPAHLVRRKSVGFWSCSQFCSAGARH